MTPVKLLPVAPSEMQWSLPPDRPPTCIVLRSVVHVPPPKRGPDLERWETISYQRQRGHTRRRCTIRCRLICVRSVLTTSQQVTRLHSASLLQASSSAICLATPPTPAPTTATVPLVLATKGKHLAMAPLALTSNSNGKRE